MEEWIRLKSTLEAMDNRKFICGECKDSYKGRSDQARITQKMRESKGCFGVLQRDMHHIDKEILFSTCIGNYFDFSMTYFFELFNHYEKGVMPFPGTVMEQPNKIIEIFRVIQSYKNAKIEREHKKSLEEAKKKRGR
jgi:hypothetical protein